MNGARILVVDEEPDAVEAMRFRLVQEGYQVSTAANGLEAVGTARAFQPDLVLLDVMRSGHNGGRLSRMLREDEALGVYPNGVKILLLTERDLSPVSPEPSPRGSMFCDLSMADRTIDKPFDLERVIREIGLLLDDVVVDAPRARPVTC